MAVAAKDGTMHHSAGKASLHDSMSKGAEKKQNVAPMKKPAGQSEAGGSAKAHPPIPQNHQHMAGPHQTPSETPIHEHVAEHGPATHVMHAHDEATGKHHVTSHHGGMGENMHHSVHDSAEEAHSHMGEAMQGEPETDEEINEGEADENPAETESTAYKGKIPGLV